VSSKEILAIGVAVTLGLVGLGIAVFLVIDAVAIAGVILHTGILASGVIASWVVPTAAVGIAGAGAASLIVVVNVTFRVLKRAPYEWALPILSLIAMFFSDLCGEFVFDKEPFIKVMFTAAVGLTLMVGGFLLTRDGLQYKVTGCALAISSPTYVLAQYASAPERASLSAAIVNTPPSVRVGFAALLVACLVALLLGFTAKEGT
jgi:hypothetical protein